VFILALEVFSCVTRVVNLNNIIASLLSTQTFALHLNKNCSRKTSIYRKLPQALAANPLVTFSAA
jgi:hypothetical protein